MAKRIGFVSSGVTDEFVQAFRALVKRERLQPIAPPALSNDKGCIALRTAGILFVDLAWHGWCGVLWRDQLEIFPGWLAGLVNALCGHVTNFSG